MHNVELTDIQGNILRGYNQPHFRYVYYRVKDCAEGRRFLKRLVPAVTTAQPWTDGKPASTLNVAFTFNGLLALGMPRDVMGEFPVEFRDGMKARAELLVDRGVSDPENWEEPWAGDGVHMWVGISANSASERDNRFDWVESKRADLRGVELAGYQDAGKLTIDGQLSPKEHFGYTDGIGNPDIANVPGRKQAGGGKIVDATRWAPLAPGEFILGYADEAGEVARLPRPMRLFRNGTFMVFRKLQQNVGSFRQWANEEGARYPGGVEHFKAKLVGRWADGTPVELSPDKPDPAIATDPSKNLNFRYGGDPLGARCPLGSHIRRANPRDATGFGGLLSNRHRIIRRGVMYGEWLPDNAVTDDGNRGILFIAFNASIERQFEFVQQQWMNFGNDFLLGNDRDPLVGNRDGIDNKLIIQGDGNGRAPWLATSLPTFVETKGGDYFFMPSLAGLRFLALAEGALEPEAFADPDMQSSLFERIGRDLGNIAHRIENDLKALPGGETIDRALHVMGGDLEHLGEHLKAWAMAQNPEPIFALLRRLKPILVLPKIAIVTKHEDCLQVLSYPTMFNVPYGPKFTELCDGGGFFLGWDDTPEYTRDLSNMRLVVRREDLPTRIAPYIKQTAEAIVDASPGKLDVVQQLGDVVPTGFVGNYIGTPSPDGNVFAPQAAALSAYLFLPVGDFKDKALAAAKSMRAVLAQQIAQRKLERGKRDDVLERCLVMQDAGVPGWDDATLLNNLFGMVVAIIPTTSGAVARALDELLKRPEQLAGAQAAAQAGNTALVTQYVFEALRFNPLGPGVFRITAQDFEVAGGTSHATTIPAGRPVLVALQSASFDPDRVPSPHEFLLERPLPEYLHFGFGLHTCFGRYINAMQIPLIVQAVLRKRNLRRAAGEAGKLQVDGPFPSTMTVEFDD
jgi:Dyp-type peroxidase family